MPRLAKVLKGLLRAASGLNGRKESELGFLSDLGCASHADAHRNIFHGLNR